MWHRVANAKTSLCNHRCPGQCETLYPLSLPPVLPGCSHLRAQFHISKVGPVKVGMVIPD
ncbi:hypothetical protein BDN71DRAFT_1457149 [Pleurotus eryngii]|uniref:Uncharacterized protein n=1 Tax=Pleurotus eryngii TaxID=5323 RepID=A0A9P6D2D7_PLEER|nr:hypothetical protein BDN71DRAFT_1457149 [Pleurotus eryngii]